MNANAHKWTFKKYLKLWYAIFFKFVFICVYPLFYLEEKIIYNVTYIH